MTKNFIARFTGMNPEKLARVIRQVLACQDEIPKADQEQIQEWITLGLVEVDGVRTRKIDYEVRPGSNIQIKFSGVEE